MNKYKSIPISAAKEIAKKYDKQQVIIVTWDAVHGKEHVTTYGDSKETCRQAALGGTKIKSALGWPDYRSISERVEEVLRVEPMVMSNIHKFLGVENTAIIRHQVDDIVYDLVQSGKIRVDPHSVMHWVES